MLDVQSYAASWQAYIAGYSGPAENLGLLDQLILVRREIAQLLGAPSFADYQLTSIPTLAATPAAVTTFLEDLAEAARPKVGQTADRVAPGGFIG